MYIFQIAALIILILGIGWKFKVRMVEAIPIGVSLLVLLLYILSFWRGLLFSDYLAVAFLVAVVIYLLRMSKQKRSEFVGFARKELTSPGMITAFIMVIVVTVCVRDKAVSWWDDYNFWATDVKSLFYLNGFADKYANVAAEFGDYPPGTQMMKWWFLHFSPNHFDEGLMFAGYYFMILAFLFPLLQFRKKRNVFQMVAGAATLWLFPVVAEAFWLDGCCADLTMAVVYGGFLAAVVDREGHDRLFYFGRQTLYLMVLVLCKNTGFIWAAFGLLFDYGYHLLVHKKENTEPRDRKRDRRALLLVTLFPLLTEGSWLSFCLLNRRVAKLTGTALQMATGSMNIPFYQEDMVKAFVEAFIKWPLHRGETFGIDLSPLGLFILLLLFVFLLYRFHILDKMLAVYTGIFLLVTGILFYSFNLLSHLTIFAVETQYLEPYGMICSIERYGAPFMIGGLYLIAFFLLKKSKNGAGMAICLIFVLITTDYQAAYRGLVGYRDTVDEVISQRNEIVDEAAELFCERVGAGGNESVGRVLYLRDISDVSWVRNTYISFEAAPVSVMYGNIDGDTIEIQDMINAIRNAHAGFLYVDRLEGNKAAVLNQLLDQGEFEYSCLYQVVDTGTEIYLSKYDG